MKHKDAVSELFFMSSFFLKPASYRPQTAKHEYI